MNNKRTKKVMGFLLSLILFCGMNMQVHAATVYTEGYFHYVIEDNAITITEYFGSEAEVTVPSVIAGYPVDTIGNKAFANADSVEKINLPDTIMTIEQGAMKDGQITIYDSNTDRPIVSGGEESNTENTNTSETDSRYNTGNNAEGGTTENTQNFTTNDNNKTEGTDIQNTTGVEEADVDLSKDDEKSVITDGKGNQISIASDNHLISTSPDGKITVLDDKNTYKMKTTSDGSMQIEDKNGEIVLLDENGDVVIPSKSDDKPKTGMILAIGIIVALITLVGVWYYRKKKR